MTLAFVVYESLENAELANSQLDALFGYPLLNEKGEVVIQTWSEIYKKYDEDLWAITSTQDEMMEQIEPWNDEIDTLYGWIAPIEEE